MQTFTSIAEITKGDLFQKITVGAESPIESKMIKILAEYGVEAWPQYPVPPYRVDIYIPSVKLIVECDGAEFHKDYAKDQKREDFLRKKGYNVIRFTGKEIYHEPYRCLHTLASEYPVMGWRELARLGETVYPKQDE